MAQTTRLTGDKRLNRKLRRLGKAGPQILGRALFKEGNEIMKESKEIVPIDKGVLKASGHVQTPVIAGKDVSVTLGYGGAAAPYAIFVHERMNVRHKPPTRAKFLEEPLNRRRSGMLRRLGDDVEGEIVKRGRSR
jgi:hypothetical protein